MPVILNDLAGHFCFAVTLDMTLADSMSYACPSDTLKTSETSHLKFEWCYFQWHEVTLNYTKPPHFHFFLSPFLFCNGLRKTSNLIDMLIIISVDEKSSLKGAWLGHVNHLNFDEYEPYHWNGWSYSDQILYTCRLCQVPAYWWKITLKRAKEA